MTSSSHNFRPNISETVGDVGFFIIGKVAKGSQMVTSPMTSGDPVTP